MKQVQDLYTKTSKILLLIQVKENLNTQICIWNTESFYAYICELIHINIWCSWIRRQNIIKIVPFPKLIKIILSWLLSHDCGKIPNTHNLKRFFWDFSLQLARSKRETAQQRKAVHIMVGRKQRVKGRAREGERPFRIMSSVTLLSWPSVPSNSTFSIMPSWSNRLPHREEFWETF